MLTWAISGIFAAPLVVRWGFRKTAILGATLIIIGFSGLFICALVTAPRWVITAVLSITGLGFGPSSMSYLLAAQESVSWQQRGIATSSIQFFRTIGGAIGIGLLGALFNALIRPGMSQLESRGIKAATLLDPHLRNSIPPEILQSAQAMISSGLKWVFATMVTFAVIQFLLTLFMPAKSASHQASRS